MITEESPSNLAILLQITICTLCLLTAMYVRGNQIKGQLDRIETAVKQYTQINK